ncbi:lipid droplet assembly factor 1-like [Sebastes umbrosus]|uniref:lipid droplet assembly factor 1-like n=1 Tax=Sebastes umbrosus TaxID=72105 RepID=UPI00189E1051|nr:lipid droplet assembly factor 1-like [Sebastes umbrosus]XP_037647013.1 lipid droplet assembly factor 1-like [Sebastes umbrosus]
MPMEMQHSSSNNGVTDLQQLWGRWNTMLNSFYDDPKVAQVMSTRMGQYLSSHPFLALTLLVFGFMSAIPVGLFLSFALVTFIMSAVGLVFFEVFLLFVGGLTLLSVLSGIALFSVMVSVILNVLYITMSNILIRYYPHLIKQGKVQEEESEYETSKLKETQ